VNGARYSTTFGEETVSQVTPPPSTQFTFRKYTLPELDACGAAIQADCKSWSCAGTGDWTAQVKDWFAGTTPLGLRTASSRHGSEFLVDLCHHDFPVKMDDETWHDCWDRALYFKRGRIWLALESEQGKYGDRGASMAMILDDAMKLANLRAVAKVMLFASQAIDNRDAIVRRLRNLRSGTEDSAPWLWLDLPWCEPRGASMTWGLLYE
jgi:hypothetical protein